MEQNLIFNLVNAVIYSTYPAFDVLNTVKQLGHFIYFKDKITVHRIKLIRSSVLLSTYTSIKEEIFTSV